MNAQRNRAFGRHGERVAADWLIERGYRIVDRNWRCARGEIDIVAWDASTLVFVEVKTRSSGRAGHPFEAITPEKTGRLRRLAATWCAEHPGQHAAALRVDAVAVHLDLTDRPVVEHLAGVA